MTIFCGHTNNHPHRPTLNHSESPSPYRKRRTTQQQRRQHDEKDQETSKIFEYKKGDNGQGGEGGGGEKDESEYNIGNCTDKYSRAYTSILLSLDGWLEKSRPHEK